MSGGQVKEIKKTGQFRYDAKTLAYKAEERRETLRNKIKDSNQLKRLLEEMQNLVDLRRTVSTTSTSLYDGKGLATQHRLLQDNLNIALGYRMKLLNKILPDDKVTVVEDKENALPELKLTLVTDDKKKVA